MAALAEFVWLSSRRARVPAKKRCNPEPGVGLLAALPEPASARLRVARRPFRAGRIGGSIRGIMAVSTDLCCGGACDTAYCGNPRSAAADGEAVLACRLCYHRLDGATIYMYMEKRFCSRDCRFEYFLEEVHDRRQREVAGMRGNRRSSRRGVKTRLVSDGEMDTFRSVFFS